MTVFGQSFQGVILQKVLDATVQDAPSVLSLRVTLGGGKIWREAGGEVSGKWHDQG